MLRSMHVLGLSALAVAACAQTSQQPAAVTAPTTSAAAPEPPAPIVAASAPPATPAPDAATGAPVLADAEDGVSPQFRSCNADTDCVAVPRGGCCPHGWREAVNVSQKDAYEKASACTRTPRPICPMFLVRDTRVARCDAQAHLCTMVRP